MPINICDTEISININRASIKFGIILVLMNAIHMSFSTFFIYCKMKQNFIYFPKKKVDCMGSLNFRPIF